MKIFIGSSSEAKQIVISLFDILNSYSDSKEKIEIIPWFEIGLFGVGDVTIESLFKIKDNIDAAIMIFTEDDDITSRGIQYKATRDNTIFEYGLFAGTHGRKNVAIATVGNPKLLSDFSGMNIIKLDGEKDDANFKTKNTSIINDWVKQITQPKSIQPKSYQNLIEQLNKLQIANPNLGQQIDSIVLNIINNLVNSLIPVNYIDSNLIDGITAMILNHCRGIYAVDVVGPQGWLNASTFKYLAPQLRQYLRNNITSSCEWNLVISDKLEGAISKSIENALKKSGGESLTNFYNPQDFKWQKGRYTFEFCRILLWSKKELMTPIAETVIAIHEAFHVPLLYIETALDSPLRNYDYILFERNDGQIDGLGGQLINNYKTEPINSGKMDRIKNEYKALLESPQLLFATDAREFFIKEGIS